MILKLKNYITKIKRFLYDTYKKVTGDAPKDELYDKFGNKLDKIYRKLESDIPTEEAYGKDRNKLKDYFADLVGSIPTEQFKNFMINQNGNKLDGIYVKEDPENIPIDIYNKKGNKLGKYISALLRQEGIDGYDKNGNKLEGKFRKYVTDGPVEDFMIQIEIN